MGGAPHHCPHANGLRPRACKGRGAILASLPPLLSEHDEEGLNCAVDSRYLSIVVVRSDMLVVAAVPWQALVRAAIIAAKSNSLGSSISDLAFTST